MSQNIIELQGVKIDDNTIGKFDYNYLSNLPILPPITYINSPDKEDRRELIELPSGPYILQGYFYANGTKKPDQDAGISLSVPMFVVIGEDKDTKIAVFFSSTSIAYYQITSDSVMRVQKKFEEIEVSSNKIDTISEESTEIQYPSAKAVYKLVNNSLTSAEKTSNKISAITNTSTDTQYPSAKAVYDLFSGINFESIGNFNMYYYSSLSAAIADANEDILENKLSSGETPKVSIIRFGPNNYRVDLLSDISESVSIAISCNIYLSLNGKTLSFVDKGELVYNENTYCTIDGTVANSAITKNTSLIEKAYIIQSLAKRLYIYNGNYSIISTNSLTEQVCILRSMKNKPDNWKNLSNEEKYKYIIDNKNSCQTYIDNCVFSCSGGQTTASAVIQLTYANFKNISIEVSNSHNVVYGIVAQAGCVDVCDCQIRVNNDKKTHAFGIYVIQNAIANSNESNIFVNTSSSTMIEIGGIYSSSGCKTEINKNIIEVSAPTSIVGDNEHYVASAVSVGYNVSIKDSELKLNTTEPERSHLLHLGGTNTKLDVINCYLESSTGIISCGEGTTFTTGITNSTMKAYSNGLCYFPGKAGFGEGSFLKDCTIITGDASELTSSITPLYCGVIAGPLLLDSCDIKVGNNVPTIFNISSTGKLSMSNCTIDKAGSQKIAMVAGSELNVGVNCNVHADIVSGGEAIATSELYRFIKDTDNCSSKDLKVCFEYITKSISDRLSSIVEGGI